MEKDNLRISVRVVCIVFLIGLLIYSLIRSYPLFGLTINLSEKELSDLSPGARVKKVLASGSEVKKQVDDSIYFTTKSDGFDKAKVKLILINGNPDQEIHLGYKDQNVWHYKTKPLYLPLIENLRWNNVNAYSPTLYQKKNNINSFEEFIKNPPQDKVVGTYYLSEDYTRKVLDGYAPKTTTTKIDVPLRGSHTFYTFLQNEKFSLKVNKQDLNWYEGADKLKIIVSKDGKVLNEKIVPDDGITDTSRKLLKTQSESIEYKGGYPENGLYKIQLVGNSDIIIKSIESSFSLLAFQSPIYTVTKSDVYSSALTSVNSNIIYTDARNINFQTYHSVSLQKVKVNGEMVDVNEVAKDFLYDSQKNRNQIEIPKGDIIVSGTGYFSFAKDQFFTPYIYKNYEVKGKDDLEKVDYLLTDYTKTFNLDGGWKQAEMEFDLRDAVYDKGKLSWIIRAPGLKENGNSILIKDIEVTLEKEPVIR